ncbi:hypothetical protein LJC36_00375 [Desulfovibrio sp. OttesenSCG-928-C14]|nr:hypothetical protein [Desulfovibrio sp. OttesenSCG-928-C14]
MADKKEKGPLDYMVRGILVGGAVGVFAGLLNVLSSLAVGAALGMLAGFFAGLTMAKKASRK